MWPNNVFEAAFDFHSVQTATDHVAPVLASDKPIGEVERPGAVLVAGAPCDREDLDVAEGDARLEKFGPRLESTPDRGRGAGCGQICCQGARNEGESRDERGSEKTNSAHSQRRRYAWRANVSRATRRVPSSHADRAAQECAREQPTASVTHLRRGLRALREVRPCP